MACIVITVSSPYHYAMKARKPQSPKRESAAISGIGVCKRTVITRCGTFPLPPPRKHTLPASPLAAPSLASTRYRPHRPNTHDGQNLPLGMPAGIVCYLAGHIWLESAHTPIAGGIPINKEDPWASTVERPPSSRAPASRR